MSFRTINYAYFVYSKGNSMEQNTKYNFDCCKSHYGISIIEERSWQIAFELYLHAKLIMLNVSEGKIDEMSASVLAIQHNNHLFARIKQKEVMFKIFWTLFGTKGTVVYKKTRIQKDLTAKTQKKIHIWMLI